MSLFDPTPEPKVKRDLCLALSWFDDDPMPHICARKHAHDGDHGTKEFGGPAGMVGVVTWVDELDDEREVA